MSTGWLARYPFGLTDTDPLGAIIRRVAHLEGPSRISADDFIAGCHRAIVALATAVDDLQARAPDRQALRDAEERGMFSVDGEAELLSWFAHLLTVRSDLWEVVGDASGAVGDDVRRVVGTQEWRCFLIGYTAACLIVRIDRLLLEEVACGSLTQRKLNEGSVLHRIPRKQYTEIFESFTDPAKARMMEQAMRFAGRHRGLLDGMRDDPLVGDLAIRLPAREQVLDPSRRRYLGLLADFVVHAFRRRGASARQQTVFAALEAGGRFASELRDHWTPPRITDQLRARIDDLLEPGDVLITRHDRAFTNLFLPGYWPHAALYVGSETDRKAMGVHLDPERAARWSGDRRVLEALKDGVLYRPLETTLAVDAVAVIRPRLDPADIARALERVSQHEGKLYNFDFDFFRSDRLVCTEVVYRAYDGIGAVEIPVRERSGRPTISAEDLLDLAVASRGFEPVAVCGGPTCPDRLVDGEQAREAILRENRC